VADLLDPFNDHQEALIGSLRGIPLRSEAPNTSPASPPHETVLAQRLAKLARMTVTPPAPFQHRLQCGEGESFTLNVKGDGSQELGHALIQRCQTLTRGPRLGLQLRRFLCFMLRPAPFDQLIKLTNISAQELAPAVIIQLKKTSWCKFAPQNRPFELRGCYILHNRVGM
jgi:hypothetical protein